MVQDQGRSSHQVEVHRSLAPTLSGRLSTSRRICPRVRMLGEQRRFPSFPSSQGRRCLRLRGIPRWPCDLGGSRERGGADSLASRGTAFQSVLALHPRVPGRNAHARPTPQHQPRRPAGCRDQRHSARRYWARCRWEWRSLEHRSVQRERNHGCEGRWNFQADSRRHRLVRSIRGGKTEPASHNRRGGGRFLEACLLYAGT